MSFQNQTFEARLGTMGDTSERKYQEHVEGKCARFGINRPEGVSVPRLPARIRACPDYLTSKGLTECLGVGRGQVVQLKLEKHGVLHFWNQVWPVSIWLWDSYKKRGALLSLEGLDTLINTPDLCDLRYFDGRKAVFGIPAQAFFDAAAEEAAA